MILPTSRCLESLHADLMIVVAYGLLLVACARRTASGCVNIHASVLPLLAWRGADSARRAGRG